MKVKDGAKPIANKLIVLREEFDDWAILFDPDTGNAAGINPVGVFIWKLLDGAHIAEEIAEKVCLECPDAPSEAAKDVDEFISSLISRGWAGYEETKG